MKKYIFALLAILSVVGCSKSQRSTNERYMTTQNVETVTDFPEEINLSSPQKVNIEKCGIMGFKVLDSMIVLSAKGENGLLRFYSKSSLAPLGIILYHITSHHFDTKKTGHPWIYRIKTLPLLT